jgi:hypothetical protein
MVKRSCRVCVKLEDGGGVEDDGRKGRLSKGYCLREMTRKTGNIARHNFLLAQLYGSQQTTQLITQMASTTAISNTNLCSWSSSSRGDGHRQPSLRSGCRLVNTNASSVNDTCSRYNSRRLSLPMLSG